MSIKKHYITLTVILSATSIILSIIIGYQAYKNSYEYSINLSLFLILLTSIFIPAILIAYCFSFHAVYKREILLQKANKDLTKKLQLAKKMETLGLLAGEVAHDLNNILQGIVGYPDLIRLKVNNDAELTQYIQEIKKSGQKANNIVQDLLTLARRGIITRKAISINGVIIEYLGSPEYKRIKANYPNVNVSFMLDDNLRYIIGSQIHFQKCIMNLIINALESIKDTGFVKITTTNQYIKEKIPGYKRFRPGFYAVIIVSDSGVGISKEDTERIFEPFYSTKEMKKSGTGLGMAVVLNSVKDHRGYIEVKSSKGKGTKFTLYFPVTNKDKESEKISIPMVEYIGAGEKILVIDDEKEQRDLALKMLLKLGYNVQTVTSGEEAIEYLKNNSADILLLDIVMNSGIDGLETYTRIIETHKEQKVIITSGYSEPERIKNVIDKGLTIYLKKPYTLEELGIAIRTKLAH